MASSRLFVKGLPPTLSEADFRKHFAQNQRHVTDVRIFPGRRIGYVGYRTAEDALAALKFFNKTFIRMSRIGVEMARPVEETRPSQAGGKALASKGDAQRTSPPSTMETGLKRKRESKSQGEEDPKLREYLEVMRPKKHKDRWETEGIVASLEANVGLDDETAPAAVDAGSDGEYDQVVRKKKHSDVEDQSVAQPSSPVLKTPQREGQDGPAEPGDHLDASANGVQVQNLSDADWARSRTSRLLGLLDDDEEAPNTKQVRPDVEELSDEDIAVPRGNVTKEGHDSVAPVPMPTPPSEVSNDDGPQMDADVRTVRSSMRLFVRNLPYEVTVEDLQEVFAPFDHLEEVHIPLDKKIGSAKGFAYIQFTDADSAEQALIQRDGQTFQGRLLHVIPATAKRDSKLDDFALSKLPLKKQQQIKKRREAASTTFNWNALYMNADAVVSATAQRLGLAKSEILDPTNSDAAVRQAHAETHIIQETKNYFKSQGVDLDAFKKSQRGDTAILVKNIPYDCSRDELKRLFEEHGDIKRFLMPPSGTIAIIGFANAAQTKTAFGALAFRKIKSSVLFLEEAPKDCFAGVVASQTLSQNAGGVEQTSTVDLQTPDDDVSPTANSATATLFVRNLNFTTSTAKLTETFQLLDGFLSARVKTKTDPKKPGQILSMGFGFLEFRTARQAQAALQVMDGHLLEGHKLQIRTSHKGADAAEERRKADAQKRASSQKTKVIIKNLPFEATKKDVRALFGPYGQLRSVRVPRKMDRGARGFAFAEFTTPKEAQSAMDALRDTHLLGRRLVLDFATGDPEDAEAEIEKMQQKVGAQVNKVALQKLTSGGRKKFTTQDTEDDG